MQAYFVRALVEPLGSAVLSVLQEHARLANFAKLEAGMRTCEAEGDQTLDDEPQKI